jgi:hypothetical protein
MISKRKTMGGMRGRLVAERSNYQHVKEHHKQMIKKAVIIHISLESEMSCV